MKKKLGLWVYISSKNQLGRQSMRFGIFPESLKNALVVSIFKEGDESVIGNYRPISLLPLFESVISERLLEFFVSNNLLSDQHGYIKVKSTQTAIFQFIQYILEFLEKGQIPLGLFLDLSKAYDTLNFDILCKKLDTYGIRETALDLIKSYLFRRKQVLIKQDN